MNQKKTYKLPVSICAAVLFFGSVLLAILMETREMAPPRKYAVDMQGAVVGIDTTSKIPVLTKEEAKDVEVKENKKVEYVEPVKPAAIDNVPEPDPIVLPSTPPPTVKEDPVPVTKDFPEIGAPKVEKVE